MAERPAGAIRPIPVAGRYGAFSVSESRVPAVRGYIRRQPEHHARVSLRDELASLLEKNGIEFDERYLLG